MQVVLLILNHLHSHTQKQIGKTNTLVCMILEDFDFLTPWLN